MPRNPPSQKKKPKPEPVEEQTDVQLPEPIEEEPPAPPVQVVERRIEMKNVEIPLGEPSRRIRQVHLNVLLTRDHAHTFARLRQGLRDKHAKTANGRQVDTQPDVLRWLMEQFNI